MSVKYIFLFAASIIKLFIVSFFLLVNSKAEDNNIKHFYEDLGTLALMYHRFNEDKYPSTNIQMDIFKRQIDIIKNNNFKFYNPDKFDIEFNKPKTEKNK